MNKNKLRTMDDSEIISLLSSEVVPVEQSNRNLNYDTSNIGYALYSEVLSRSGHGHIYNSTKKDLKVVSEYLRTLDIGFYEVSDYENSQEVVFDNSPNELSGKLDVPGSIIKVAFNTAIKQRPALYLNRLKDVYMVFSGRHFCIFSLNEKKIHSSSSFLLHEKVIESLVKKCETFSKVFFSGDFRGMNNVCHFSYDCLPRALLAKDLLGYDRFLFNPTYNTDEYQAQLLDLAQIDRISLPDYSVVHFDELAFFSNVSPEDMCHPTFHYHGGLTSQLSMLGNKLPKEGQRKKFYISRKDAHTRQILNEKEVEEKLVAYGFEVIVPRQLSALEQFSVFRNAEVIVGSHGAGLTGLFFCDNSTKIIEIFNPEKGTAAYGAMSYALGLNYDYILGEPRESEGHHDIVINIEELIEKVTY
ncbi:glycosyltransferase family 61 protein [Alteromonas sp. OM2203]|uniref:glycosyltransferase family 61 protein n=1 Tax=Alteromonas sp. OM2203 TaxID=3398817 RepID=UPI003AF335AC